MAVIIDERFYLLKDAKVLEKLEKTMMITCKNANINIDSVCLFFLRGSSYFIGVLFRFRIVVTSTSLTTKFKILRTLS